ncbi:unnamed protein product [Oncorhynchus mykiss]|uniref:TPPC8 third Ig-like domain-containing protein n=1 Tax=Oncorhynchus mykiss TaxID=8022 RepID=A0A060W892_ONCMY|nr:unnamed protein product [Oncorhynchus mykiss]
MQSITVPSVWSPNPHIQPTTVTSTVRMLFKSVCYSSEGEGLSFHPLVVIPDCKLTSRERGKLCFRATRCKPLQVTLKAAEKYTFADLSLGNELIITSTTPCADFFFRRCQPLESLRPPVAMETQGRHSRSQGVGHGGGDKDIAGVVRKCNEVDLDIIILWKAFVVEDNKQVILEGQLHVALQTIDKEACSLTQKEVNACNNCKHSNHHFVLTV